MPWLALASVAKAKDAAGRCDDCCGLRMLMMMSRLRARAARRAAAAGGETQRNNLKIAA